MRVQTHLRYKRFHLSHLFVWYSWLSGHEVNAVVNNPKNMLGAVIFYSSVLIQPDYIVVHGWTGESKEEEFLQEMTWLINNSKGSGCIYKISRWTLFSTRISDISSTNVHVIRIVSSNSAYSALLKDRTTQCLVLADLIPSPRVEVIGVSYSWWWMLTFFANCRRNQ